MRTKKIPELDYEDTKRFFNYIDKTGDCHTWQASKTRNGYGQFSIKNNCYASHRIAYKITYGEIPQGMFVCHKCDNPPCCNPEHLFLGYSKDNVQDMIKKGRQVSRTKLTEKQVMDIYNLKGKISQQKLGERFGISQASIGRINTGMAFSEITGQVYNYSGILRKLTDEQVIDIYNLKGKTTSRKLSRDYDISYKTIESIWYVCIHKKLIARYLNEKN